MNRKFIVGLIFCLFGALICWGQAGTLVGTITDPSGKPVPNSVITITNLSTNLSQRVVTGADGTFMAAIPPGAYRVEVETAGFKRMVQEQIQVISGNSVRIAARLEAGPAVETVEINADAVETQDTPPEIQRGYGQAILENLPVFDRNYLQLMNLMPGITPPFSAIQTTLGVTADPQRSRQWNTNGQPAYSNDSTLDGDTVREPFTGDLNISIPPRDYIRELQIQTANYRAEQGFAGGSIDNVFTRPGTNGLHGQVYGFFSPGYFQARNPLFFGANPSSPLHYWQTGAGVGGAIKPDHTFLFINYEATRYRDGTPVLGTLPTAAIVNGNFTGTGATIFSPAFGTVIPAGDINPLSQAILATLPAPNLPGFFNNTQAVIPFTDNSSVVTGRLDHRFSDAYSVFLDYQFSYFNATQGSLFGPIVGGGTASGLRNHHATAALVANSHGIIGELRFTYNRYRNNINATGVTGSLAPLLAANGFTSLPTINIEGFGTLGAAANIPSKMFDNTYEGSAVFHWARGIHDVRFGTDIRALQANGWRSSLFGPNGTLFFGPGATLSTAEAASVPLMTTPFNSLAAFLLGAPVASGVFNYANVPTYRQNLYSGFVADTVRLFPRFTMELGLRYDLFSPVSTSSGNGALLYNPLTGTVTFGSQLHNYDFNNFSPRVGFAYHPMERTVVRASYAIQYFPLPFTLSGINQAGFGAQTGLINGSFAAVPFSIPTVTPTTPGPIGSTVAAPNIPLNLATGNKTPYLQTYYLMVQQDLRRGFLFDAAYVGNVGRQLPFVQALNVAAPGTGLAGLPFTAADRVATADGGSPTPVIPVVSSNTGVNLYGQGLTSNYNALQVNLTKRLSQGLGFTVAYTWSKALDHGTFLVNPFSRAANYGPADWDRTQMLTISHVFEIPFGTGTNHLNTGWMGQILAGWSLNGLFQWGTGTPFSVLAPATACNCPGIPAVFAAPVGAVGINGQASFNPALFTSPGADSLGPNLRNAFRGPNFQTYNLSLFKSFRIAERARMELRGEGFNILNSPVYGNPYANLGNPNFGFPSLQSSNLVNGFAPRTFQVAARILF
ncbi:MAG: TonB-dependent receptor [Bryobacterales bacterium]|nr:TonB-dependent receptor [Bryobacterales bacterium]